MEDSPVYAARALVLRDLQSTRVADATAVSLLEEAVTNRSWWVEQWPDGAAYVAGLVAQDVQDALLSRVGRWPLCSQCNDAEPHAATSIPSWGDPTRCGSARSPAPRWLPSAASRPRSPRPAHRTEPSNCTHRV